MDIRPRTHKKTTSSATNDIRLAPCEPLLRRKKFLMPAADQPIACRKRVLAMTLKGVAETVRQQAGKDRLRLCQIHGLDLGPNRLEVKIFQRKFLQASAAFIERLPQIQAAFLHATETTGIAGEI